MLSFLRDPGAGELPAQKSADAAGKSPAQGADKSQEQEYVAVAVQGSSVRKTTTLLAVLFFVGIACLWFMIRKSAPQSASAEESQTDQAKVEAAITRITGVKSEMSNRMGEIVNKFYEFSEVPQVRVGELVKNPFELEMFLASLRRKLGASEGEMAANAELMRQQEIAKQVKSLQLMSIMESKDRNCCMISNKLLYVGDRVGDFKVSVIGDSFVKLKWEPEGNSSGSEDLEIVLKLSE